MTGAQPIAFALPLAIVPIAHDFAFPFFAYDAVDAKERAVAATATAITIFLIMFKPCVRPLIKAAGILA